MFIYCQSVRKIDLSFPFCSVRAQLERGGLGLTASFASHIFPMQTILLWALVEVDVARNTGRSSQQRRWCILWSPRVLISHPIRCSTCVRYIDGTLSFSCFLNVSPLPPMGHPFRTTSHEPPTTVWPLHLKWMERASHPSPLCGVDTLRTKPDDKSHQIASRTHNISHLFQHRPGR